MKKNKITELDGWGTLKGTVDGKHGVEVDKDGDKASYTCDNLDHRHRREGPDAAGDVGQRQRRDLRGADPRRRAPRQDRDRRLGRDRRRVRLRHEELRRRRHHRRVPRPDGPDRGRGRVQGAAQAVQEARRRGAALDQGRRRRGHRLGREGHRQPGRRWRQQGHRGGQVPRGVRVRTAARRLRPRGDRRRDHRPRRHRRRRPRPHQRARRLRDRRRHRQADARPHRGGDGRGGGRDDRRRGHDRDRLRLHPAGDVLPAADRLVRLLRGAGQGEGLRRQDGPVPVLGQRQGARHGRGRRAS